MFATSSVVAAHRMIDDGLFAFTNAKAASSLRQRTRAQALLGFHRLTTPRRLNTPAPGKTIHVGDGLSELPVASDVIPIVISRSRSRATSCS